MSLGVMKWGTDESQFNAILCSRSFAQLQQIFIEYQKISGHDIEKTIAGEFSGDIEDGLLALGWYKTLEDLKFVKISVTNILIRIIVIVKSMRDRSGFFAEALHNSLKGMGTNDRALIRILVIRCEIDLADIKLAYQSMYSRTVEDAISVSNGNKYRTKNLIYEQNHSNLFKLPQSVVLIGYFLPLNVHLFFLFAV